MGWAEDKARDLIAVGGVDLGPRGRALVERAIRETIAKCAAVTDGMDADCEDGHVHPDRVAAAIRKLENP